MKTKNLFALYRLVWGEGAETLVLDSKGRLGLEGGENDRHRLFLNHEWMLTGESEEGRPSSVLSESEIQTGGRLRLALVRQNVHELFLLQRTGRPWGVALGEKLKEGLEEIHREWCSLASLPCSDEGLRMSDFCLLSDRLSGRPYSLSSFRVNRLTGIGMTFDGPSGRAARIDWAGRLFRQERPGSAFVKMSLKGETMRLLHRALHTSAPWFSAFVEGKEERL